MQSDPRVIAAYLGTGDEDDDEDEDGLPPGEDAPADARVDDVPTDSRGAVEGEGGRQ